VNRAGRAETGSTSSRPARSLTTLDAGELGGKNESCVREREDRRQSEAWARSPVQEDERARPAEREAEKTRAHGLGAEQNQPAASGPKLIGSRKTETLSEPSPARARADQH
jgi:hypothetical protein